MQSIRVLPVDEMIMIGPEELEVNYVLTVFVFDSQG
jgi:hypothetical protein